MSSTNKTTNYELSQFIGTDKPAWLTDYNADMSKIDTGVATAQGTATGADTKATANATAIGTLANLTTDAKTNLVAAINEVDTHTDAATNTAASAVTTANTAAANANTAINNVNSLAAYLTMSNITKVAAANISANSGTITSSSITVALNSDGTFGKIYGNIRHRADAGDVGVDITLNYDSGIHPSEDLVINGAGLGTKVAPSTLSTAYVNEIRLTIKPNGNIVIRYWPTGAGDNSISLFPCAYFFENFGDEPVNP